MKGIDLFLFLPSDRPAVHDRIQQYSPALYEAICQVVYLSPVMSMYWKRGSKRIGYYSKLISHNLKSSQQDNSFAQQGTFAVGSSTE